MTLLDLGSGVNGFAKTALGGFYGVVLDEVMGSAAQMQAGELPFAFLPIPWIYVLLDVDANIGMLVTMTG